MGNKKNKSEFPEIEELLDFIKNSAKVPGEFKTLDCEDELCFVIDPADLVSVCQALKETEPYYFLRLADITAVDYPEKAPRFELIYQLYSFKLNQRLLLSVWIKENESIDSLTNLWPAANWLERECFDMFGIDFDGHPDLQRIFMSEQSQSHPLRKDYPVSFGENFRDKHLSRKQSDERCGQNEV
jgi:NADH-quinone oxidoreductase subunit C